jgi:hypothetical protein
MVRARGLQNWLSEDKIFRAKFKVASGKYSETSLNNAVRVDQFVRRLFVAGLDPVKETDDGFAVDRVYCGNEKPADLVYWFNVSSPVDEAYYMLKTIEGRKTIVTSVWTNRLTGSIVQNVKCLDAKLHKIIEACELPRPPQLFVKWLDVRQDLYYTGPFESERQTRELLTGMRTTRGRQWGVRKSALAHSVPLGGHLLRPRAHMIMDIHALGKALLELEEEKRAAKSKLAQKGSGGVNQKP